MIYLLYAKLSCTYEETEQNSGSIWLHEWFRCSEKILISEYGVICHLLETLAEHYCVTFLLVRSIYVSELPNERPAKWELRSCFTKRADNEYAKILCDRRTDLVAAFYPSKREGIRGPHRDYFSLLPGWHWREWVDGNRCYLINLEATLDRHPA